MLEVEGAAALAQFGTAGLVGWLWLAERRSASAREAELRRTHERLIEDRRALESMLGVLRDNTHALTSVETGLKTVAHAVSMLRLRVRARDAGASPEAARGE
ncbi:MAG: hypothetical protein AAGK04_11690 [Planctomycetota bacterium]